MTLFDNEQPDQSGPQGGTPKQGYGSLAEPIDRANQAIAGSCRNYSLPNLEPV